MLAKTIEVDAVASGGLSVAEIVGMCRVAVGGEMESIVRRWEGRQLWVMLGDIVMVRALWQIGKKGWAPVRDAPRGCASQVFCYLIEFVEVYFSWVSSEFGK